MEQFVRPINIPSPISGQPVAPRIITRDYWDKVVVEAHWIDPSSGAFIRKGIVEIREKNVIKESTEGMDAVLLRAAEDPDYMYDLYSAGGARRPSGASEAESAAANYIYRRYEEITSDPEMRLHGDDDFESILTKIADEIEQDFR
jgi:hypothetical protein